MAAAIAQASQIDPALCRATARERFGQDRMITSYFAAYRQLAG